MGPWFDSVVVVTTKLDVRGSVAIVNHRCVNREYFVGDHPLGFQLVHYIEGLPFRSCFVCWVVWGQTQYTICARP